MTLPSRWCCELMRPRPRKGQEKSGPRRIGCTAGLREQVTLPWPRLTFHSAAFRAPRPTKGVEDTGGHEKDANGLRGSYSGNFPPSGCSL